jgi:hypothetical protein
LGVTTAVALLASIAAALPLTPHCREAIGYGAVLQGATLGAWAFGLWVRRPIVSRETI